MHHVVNLLGALGECDAVIARSLGQHQIKKEQINIKYVDNTDPEFLAGMG